MKLTGNRYNCYINFLYAVHTNCRGCHVDQNVESPEFDAETVSHKVHGGKLDCAASHMRNTMACYNCHFGTFLKTGSKSG